MHSAICGTAPWLPAKASDRGDVHRHPEEVSRGGDGGQLPRPWHGGLHHLHPRPGGLHYHGLHGHAQSAGTHLRYWPLRRGVQDRGGVQERQRLHAQAWMEYGQNHCHPRESGTTYAVLLVEM